MIEIIRKLFNGHDGYILNNGKNVEINLTISKETLIDNIDLLSKEMHMAVELQAILKRKTNHKQIKVDYIKIMKEL